MRITPMSNNQTQNTNFSARRVPEKLIADFKKVCPDTLSLRDEVMYDYGTDLINTHLSKSICGEVFSESIAEFDRLFRAMANVVTAMQQTKKEFRVGAFREGWECNTGAVGAYKREIDALIKNAQANPIVTQERLDAFLPRVQATQEAFLSNK